MSPSTDRQTFRQLVAEVAARAKFRLPVSVNGRIESAVKLVLSHDVEPQDDGTILVGSSTDALKTYTLAGQACDCQDFAYGKAPSGWCCHRIAAGIQKRVQELLPQSTAVETEPAPASPAVPLPEAPASVNVHLMIDGRDVQLTLRDHDEARLLQRLAAVLAQYPVQAPASSQGQPARPTPPRCAPSMAPCDRASVARAGTVRARMPMARIAKAANYRGRCVRPSKETTMQAYWNNPENKDFMMVLMLEEHEGFPPVLTPDSPPGSGALDYEERLGIPLPIALVGEWVWLGAPQAYAATWPARFFDTIQPNQNLSEVVWKVVELVMLVMRDHGRDWPVLGEHLLAVLARAPMSTPGT